MPLELSAVRVAVVDSVVPNDNRRPAGRMRDGVLDVRLIAKRAAWRPDLDVDTMMTVQAFAGDDGVPRIPGPLIRAAAGTTVRITLTNALDDSTLIVRGLRAGHENPGDTLQLAPSATRVVTFRADRPGTYFYWGSRSGRPSAQRWGRDGQLAGAIVIDSAGARRDPDERLFVITLVDSYGDSVTRVAAKERVWEVAVNGRSWPHTERLRYEVGDTIRWRWINASDRLHPMHLHGFHFLVTASGTWFADTAFAPDTRPEMVTRTVLSGGSFAMEWTPTRAGNWLIHCHMAGHMSPYPVRPDSVRAHDHHDPSLHPTRSMAGLVMGIRIDGHGGLFRRWTSRPADTTVAARHRLVVGERRGKPGERVPRGYVIQTDRDPAPDSVEVPGTPLILRRGERAAITVVNRLSAPTSVHWHGMELEGRYDGVAGWSGTKRALAPLIAPGDSFTVYFTPPRAGTFIYHSHMEEEAQLGAGMYGAMLVLEPGDTLDPETDRTIVVGHAVVGGREVVAIDGSAAPAPIELVAGTAYRLRVISILPNEPFRLSLVDPSGRPVPWRVVAKDAVPLPPSLARAVTEPLVMGVGETYDFTWTPGSPGDVTLLLALGRQGRPMRQLFRVRAR